MTDCINCSFGPAQIQRNDLDPTVLFSDHLNVFLKDFFEKVYFDKISRKHKKTNAKLPSILIHVVGLQREKTCLRGACEQQRCRPACASAQSNQHLCYSLILKYYT